jgi:type IV pilus assembly protein PilM
VGLFDKFFSKQKSLVGLDIGSSCVKLIELKPVGKSGTEFKLVKAGMEMLPPEAIVDGAIMDSGAIVDAINRLFANLKIKTSDVATSVSGNAVIVKKISLPQMSAEELGESIHWEAEQYIPFDIQDVSLDYEILEGSGDGGNMDVLLVAVKKDKISDYTSVITQSGKTPRIVDVDVFALQNCHEINYGVDSGRVVALLNLGAAITNVNIVRGSNSLFNRDIAVGGNLATDALQKDLGLPYESAEALKRGEQIEGTLPDSVFPVIQNSAESIVSEIQKTFDFFRATTQEERIDQIFLAGGSSRLQGLRELLMERLDTQVDILNPFNAVTYSPKEVDGDLVNQMGPAAAIAVGLAVRKVGDR